MNTFFSRSSFNGSGRTFVVAAIAVMTLVLAPGAQAALGTCDNANNIDVESTGGTASAGYATLSAAFAAINAGTHTGTITVEVCGNTAEPAAGAILNASGSGAASYGTILVNPVGGAPRTITGAATAGLPLVDLNGADNVTINGLNTGGDALTIANTTASATSGTATIRFIGGATLNTITNTSIQGSFSATVATNGGTIYFATDAVTANGNDNNTISNCDIGPAGANLPTKGIFINGSTTTTALANSGIVINNNNIHDYFGASVASAGIYVGSGGSTDDNFTNNRFYQSATRTQVTTASQHSAIWITNTAGNNFLVAGNTIGFATSAGTGTYTFVTISGSSFVPIFLSVGTTTATSVQGNTIAGIAISGAAASTGTSATFRGLYVSSGLTTVGDVVGNTIGSQVATGSITFTSSSASTADVMGMYNFGSSNWTTNNNTIGGITASNSSTGAVNFYGLRVNTGSAVTFTCQNNTIGGNVANSIQSTTTAAATTVEGIITANAISTITGNLIRNLTAAGGTGTTSGASVIGIVSTASSANHTVRQNSIHTLSNTNASAATTIIGIQYAGSTGTNLVARNFIHSFSAASATAVLNGINVGGGTTTYANNMIRLGVDASGAGITVGCAINGINELLLGTDSFYFNSVYVGGSGVVSSLNTFAFNSTQITVARAFQNNIFYNARSNASGTGKNYAVQVGGTTANPAGLTLNYNVYLADGSGGVFGRFNALDVASLAAWKTAVGQDANSFDSDPMYLTPTGTVSTLDLHINPAIVTVIEGNGLPIGAVTDDFDGQTRSGLTPTDIGADAGSFLGIDLTAPVIAYTALANPTLTTNRTLTTSVTDPGSGVPTSGIGLPAIYFRKGVAGAYASTQCTYVSGSNYSCVIDYTLVTGGSVATGDTVNYYVAAQDAAATPNVITSPVVGAGLFTANPPAAGTPPITPSSYVISPAITGTKTVCASGCDYTTLTGATGIFNAVNTSVATGSIIIEIAGDLTAGEDGSVALNPLAEEPTGSNFTVHLYPTGVARAITSTTLPSGGFIRLNAADRVNIDGSLGGVGTDRSLTITEANTGTVSAVIWLQSNATDGAQNNTIKNLNVVGNSNVTTLIGIGMGSSTVSTASAGTNNNGNTIQNNNISKTQNGIVTLGLSAAAKNTGNVITQNLINTASPNNVAKNGIQVGFENAIQITNNNVSGMAQASSPDVFGITLGITGISTTTFTGNEVTNAIVSGNVIGTVRNTGTFSACGLCVAPATSGTNQIFNNVLTGVSANGTGGDFSVGILIGGGAGSTTQVYFNSVSMNGTQTGGSDKSYALAIGGADPIVDVRNNALYNTLNNGTGNNYAVAFGYSTFVNLTSNKNDLFVTTPSALHFAGATASLSAPTNQATLANLQAATGKDALSIGLDPLFNNPLSNLQPLLGSPLVGAGTPVGIPLDILGVVRSASTPTIGAYELAIDTAGPVIVYTALGNTTSALNRTLSVTVTDASGVPTSGIGLPAIYFRKGVVGAFATTQCSHISGSSYDCLIDYALVTGGSVAPGDTVQYYVAAQDSIGNVSVSPATGASGLTANPPAAATAPTTPSSYLISIGYSSSYTVGSGGTYPSLTNPGGIFEAINAGVLTGNVTIDIVSDLTGETGAVALNQWAEDGVGPYTLLIKPSGAPRQILGSNIGALIRLNGADRVTIDGSTTGAIATGVGGNSAIRELTIQNTNTGTSAAVIAVGSGTNGAQNNTIRNVNVLGQDPTTTLIGISLGGTAPGTVGTDNDNNRVENCSVKRALFGIYSAGADAVNPNTGTVITMNETSAVAGDRIRRVGVMVFNENGIGITQNSINGISTNESADGIGIAVGNQSVDSTNTTAGGVTNALVARNKINGVASLSTTGFSAVGITVGGTTGGANTIVNNMITGVTAPATSPDVVAGIYVVGAAGSSTRIYDNSIAMTGDRGAVASQMPSFGVAVTGADPTVELKNNVFYTTQIASGGGINAKSYAIGLVTTTFANLDSNYNDFWSTGANDGGFRSGSLSTATGTDYANLGAWQTAVSDDANSLEADPAFVSATTDLHIASPGFSPVENVGTPLAAVTVDIDGDTRNATTPDIGSDEVDRCAGVTCTNTACATYSCDGADGVCKPSAYAPEFTACGDSDATACNAADSCNATGTCIDRKKTSGTVCLAGTGTCDPDDTCDGTTNACAAVHAPALTACGDPDTTNCNAADSCDALGTCVDRKKASGFVCLAGAGTCDPDDVCDGTTNACAAVLAAEFTACGDPDTTNCNAADSCDALGTCVDRKKASGFVCLAGAGICDPDDTCDGTTNACAAVYAPALTACGDPDTTNCNAADSCDALGTCVDRKKASGFVCLAGTGTCDPDDICDGTTNACAAVYAPALTACGDPDTTNCNAADSCDALGTCVDRKKASGFVCLAGTGTCDPDDVCDGTTNACAAVLAAEFTACGDPDTTNCNAADSCDALGTCVDRKKASGFVCLAGTGTCDPDDICDGTTNACAAVLAAEFTACGDTDATACNAADSCDALGTCVDRKKASGFVCLAGAGTCDPDDVCDGTTNACAAVLAAEFTACGDTDATACNAADSCDALGTCVDRKKASGFVCLAGAGTCDPDDVCDGTTNACAAVHAPALTACGDPDTTNCNAADSCDALGTCVDRKKASGFVCLAGTGTCDPDDVCDGTTNACAAVHAPALTACGDPDATDCNAADSCNATGTCVNRFKPSTTVCRPSAGGCDAAESCTGSSSTCPADASGGPATLTATGGVTGPTSYATLGAAFTAINAGTHTGAITIDICANLNEGVTPATLNSSGAGSASYISVLVRPVAPGLSVVGSPVTGFGVIQLNGADSVTIDGDDPNTPGINRDLTIGNTAAASVAANSVIRIATSTAVTSANDNTIKNLILNGNVTGGNLSTITSATSSSGQSYGIYAGGNGGATATGAPTALTTAPASALSTTTINALTVDNNAINQCARGVFFNGAATSVSTGVTITNNTIGTPGVPTPATPPYTAPATTVYVRGIGISGATAATIAGNTIQNVISYVGVGVAGVELTSAIGIGPINVNNNAITNVVQNVGSFYARGVSMVSASGTYGLAGNNITNIQNFSGSSANQPNGIFASTTATSATIELNKVTTITNRNTGTFGVQGVTLTAGNNVTFRNNVISDVTQNMSGGTAFSTTFGVVGLRIAGGTGHKIYHNSVNMFGTLLGTATSSQLTAAFAIVGTGQTGIDVRNNIFANTMTGGTTSIAHVPVVLPSSGTSAMNLTWNNNAYYTGSTAGVHGIAHVGTTYTAVPAGPATYAGLYTAANFAPGSTAGTTNFRSYTSTLLTANTNNDNASFGAATAAPFATTTDLHINTGLASTPLESGGAGAGVTGVFIDIDAQTRPGPTGSVNGGATAPDIGADEFDGVPPLPNDMQATAFVDPTNGGTKPEGVSFSPQASFTNNGTATQTGVTVRYRILNNLAVEVYNQTATIASAAPSVTTTVTFPATSLTAGSYAIKATAELVGDQATGNDEITGSLAVESPLCGNYDVGSGGVFASLTNANGAFAKLNSLGATCSVTFSVISDLTGETGSVAVNQWAEFGIGGYTLTIRPSGGARSISGPSTTSGLIILNGADRVTIDGSVSGGTDRSLTITNTNTGAAVVWIRSASALDGSNFDTVKNCILTGNSGTTTVAGVVAGSGVTFGSPAEFPNSNNTIQNNVITKVQNALYLFGNATVLDQNWLITGNTFGSTVAGDKLGFRGMLIGNAQAFTISHNTINGVVSSTTSSSTMTGIQLASSIATGAISRNRISDIKQTNTGGWGSNGIFLAAATTASDVTVSNNFIWDVASQGFNGVDQADNGYGIVVASGGGYKIYANSVNLNTNQVAATGITAGLNVLAAVTTVGSIDLRDNIFSSVQTIGTRYGVLSSAPATVFATINTNDYFAQNVGFIGGSAKATLASWQAATGQDASSIAANPQFVSTTDLHIASPGFSPVENVGTPLAAVTVDIDGETRSGTTPDIGADEVDRCAIVTCTNTTCTTYSCDGADGVCKPSAYAPEFTACGDPDATACNAPDSCNAIGSCVDRKQTLGSICLAGSGACDPDDTCDGLSAICAPNYASASTTCGDAEGPCTNQDFCNGGGACTDNGFKGAGTICLAGTGTCDPNDVCNGTNAVCTPVYAPPSATCGDAEGPCTNQDYCNGSGACADNGYKSASTVCLIGTGTCDPDDTCDGTTGACAAVYTAENTACGDPDATECNAPDSCNATGSCVLRFKPASFECRGSTVLCDPAEFCTGTSATCPVNAINQSDPVGPTVMVSYNKPTHTSTISWTEAIPGPFNVYRGSLTTGAAFAYNQSCFDYAVPGASTADMLTPRPGRLFFYLVSRKQVPCGESSVGQDSLGADRPNPLVCPLAPPDTDGDGFQDSLDNCPLNYNPSQSDVDSDNRGDACDNCVNVYNPDQLDSNNNGIGDACDPL